MGSGRGIVKKLVFDATSLPAGVTDSDPISGIAGGDDMSFFVKLTGSGGDVEFKVLTSEDASEYCEPVTGAIIIVVTDEVLHHALLRFPVCPSFKIRATNSGSTVVCSAKTLSV